MMAEAYARDGYLVLPEPVVPPPLLRRAVAGMEAVRRGEYSRGRVYVIKCRFQSKRAHNLYIHTITAVS